MSKWIAGVQIDDNGAPVVTMERAAAALDLAKSLGWSIANARYEAQRQPERAEEFTTKAARDEAMRASIVQQLSALGFLVA